MKKNYLSKLLPIVALQLGSSIVSLGQENLDISWKHVTDLPTPKGYEKQIGVAGPIAGNIGDYLLVGGGANFPKESVLDGGPRVLYPDLYLYKANDEELKLISHLQLPNEIGYGSTISTKDKIYYIGGSHQDSISNKIISLQLNKEKDNVILTEEGELPFTYHSGVSVLKGDKIYILTGRQDNVNSSNFISYDLKTKKVEKLAEFPGGERSQSVGQILKQGKNEKLYIFGGGTGVAYTDGYSYDFASNSWEKVSDVMVGDQAISLLGANSIKYDSDEMIVIGGFNKEIWDDANHYLGSLKGEELKKYRHDYFTKDPQDFNWNSHILVYNAEDNKWRSVGEVPFNAPCGEGLVLIDDVIFSINGEIKPGVRSERIYAGKID